jgi:hypothetical protein
MQLICNPHYAAADQTKPDDQKDPAPVKQVNSYADEYKKVATKGPLASEYLQRISN